MFSNNNFQFLNIYTKRILNVRHFLFLRIHDVERQDERNEAEDGGPLVLGSSSSMKIREPPKWFFRSWRIIFGVSCVIAVALDPLFFYVPVINEDKKCIGMDKKLGAISLILRSVTDIIGIINIILQFHDEYTYIDKASGNVIKDFRKIAKTYLWPYFVIDILVILPFPQVRESFIQFIVFFKIVAYLNFIP